MMRQPPLPEAASRRMFVDEAVVYESMIATGVVVPIPSFPDELITEVSTAGLAVL